MGVPVTAHRCTVGSRRTISAAFDTVDSTICASSRTTRHHFNRVSGVGTTSYFFSYRRALSAPAKPCPLAVSMSISVRSVSYVVSTMSASASSLAENTPFIEPPAPLRFDCPSYVMIFSVPGRTCCLHSSRHCLMMALGQTTSVAPHVSSTVSLACAAMHLPHVKSLSFRPRSSSDIFISFIS